MTPLRRNLDQMARTAALETVLARIIDDPLVVKLLVMRDPDAWGAAVELLADFDEAADRAGPGA